MVYNCHFCYLNHTIALLSWLIRAVYIIHSLLPCIYSEYRIVFLTSVISKREDIWHYMLRKLSFNENTFNYVKTHLCDSHLIIYNLNLIMTKLKINPNLRPFIKIIDQYPSKFSRLGKTKECYRLQKIKET